MIESLLELFGIFETPELEAPLRTVSLEQFIDAVNKYEADVVEARPKLTEQINLFHSSVLMHRIIYVAMVDGYSISYEHITDERPSRSPMSSEKQNTTGLHCLLRAARTLDVIGNKTGARTRLVHPDKGIYSRQDIHQLYADAKEKGVTCPDLARV